MNNITLKIDNAMSITKNFNFNKDTRVLLFSDNPGWTNGYIANLLDIDIKQIKAKAILKDCRHNFEIPKKDRPKAKTGVRKVGKGYKVEDIEWDLLDNSLILKSKAIRSKINPTFYKYFVNAYKEFGGVDLEVTSENTPVKVIQGDDLVGLIMPIKSEE